MRRKAGPADSIARASSRLRGGGEVAREECVPRTGGNPTKRLQGRSVRSCILERADDLLMDRGGVVGAAQVDEEKPPLELPPELIGNAKRGHRGPRGFGHLDVVDAAVGGGGRG